MSTQDLADRLSARRATAIVHPMTNTQETTMTDITNDCLPVFVYGTLRPGWANARYWEGRGEARHDGAATVDGFRLVAGAFPFALPAADEVTVGALVYPDVEHYDAVLADMDRLEGYPHFYDRQLVVVHTPAGIAKAWIYTPVDPLRFDDMAAVAGNDWTSADPERRRRRSLSRYEGGAR